MYIENGVIGSCIEGKDKVYSCMCMSLFNKSILKLR